MVHFERDEINLLPDTVYDNAGAYSGSALPLDDKRLFVMYTGNHRDKDWRRIPYQLGAVLDNENHLTKYDKPLIEPDFTKVTEHFRDPQIFRFQGQIYVIIGAQDTDKKGEIELYKALDETLENWQTLGSLIFTEQDMGYMIECPNLVFVDGHALLIFCPQGLDKAVCDYQNVYPNMFVLADEFLPAEKRLTGAQALQNLDDGFDCYATQAFNAPDGRALAVSWLGLPDTDYATDAYGYQGALSLVKELRVRQGKLYQYPVAETKQLRGVMQPLELTEQPANLGQQFELELDFAQLKQNQGRLKIFSDASGQAALEIEFDKTAKRLTVYRGNEKRQVQVVLEQMNLFIDHSIFELFINQGEKVLSGRVFPSATQTGLSSSYPVKIKMWELNK